MKPFSSVHQYEVRYGDAEDLSQIEEVLMDATREICAALEKAGIDYSDPTEGFADRLMQSCRSMAYRSVGEPLDTSIPFGATQLSNSAGEYSQSYTLGNPYSEMYISKAERRLLGIDAAKIGFSFPGATT